MRHVDVRLIPDREYFEDLLQRARAGSENHLALLFDAFRPYLRSEGQRKLPAYLRSKVSPSDFFQETYLDVRRAFKSFRGNTVEEARCWLRTIYLNRMARSCRQYLHFGKRNVFREFSLESKYARAQLRQLAGQLKTPLEVLVEQEIYLRIEWAWHHLPMNDQVVIQLRMTEKKRFDEVGQRMGCSSNTARMMCRRAMRRWARLSRDDAPDDER
jgi:RNA polymerase sigma-70 factor (subfamily 1)